MLAAAAAGASGFFPAAARRRGYAAATGCAVIVAVVTALVDRLRFPLPEPTGPEDVGTTTFEWTDESRAETATATPNDLRMVVVQVWYPADPRPDDNRSLYLGRTAEEARLTADGLAATLRCALIAAPRGRRGAHTRLP